MAGTVADDGPHPVDRHVGHRVHEKRLSLGYNQSDLGRALSLTFQQVQKYERGANRISASKLWDISRFFNVDIAYFFDGLDASEQSPETSEPKPIFAATRHSVEIARIAPQLSTRQQKLALDLIREMAEGPHLDAA